MAVARRNPSLFQRLVSLVTGRTAPTAPSVEQQRLTGRIVLDGLRAEFDRRATAYANGLAEGRISIDTFRNLMAQDIRRSHLAAAIAASPTGRPSGTALATAQRRADEQVAFLNRFAAELRDGRVPVDAAGRIRQRARLYGGALNATFHDSRAAALGIQLSQRPGDGKTVCLTNCKCQLDFEEDAAEVRVYWRLGVAEHCPDCLSKAAQWNPLRFPK